MCQIFGWSIYWYFKNKKVHFQSNMTFEEKTWCVLIGYPVIPLMKVSYPGGTWQVHVSGICVFHLPVTCNGMHIGWWALKQLGMFFSCDQAALWMVQSVCLSVCDAFFTMFPSSYHHEIFRSYNQWHKWCPCKRLRSEFKGQGHRGQNPI